MSETLWTGTDPYDSRTVEAVVYGDRLHLEDEDTSLFELTPAMAAGLGAALTRWAEAAK